ncbi:MAG: ADP-ribosylglycohydrolase [Deltaproteobacteria bacterium]|nr:ADP-ribosylglycohydrolase [Deltaproteobacteria bacterium]
MIGAIAGDIIGSVYEHHNIKVVDFPLFNPGCRFTDDTVLTVAIADAILSGSGYAGKLREYCLLYPERGYGPGFRRWAVAGRSTPYNSKGNGSAMRVSSIGSAFGTLEEVLRESKRSAEVTHNHPEGIKGAQAVASAVFLARTGTSKEDMKAYIRETFEYDLSEPIDSIRTHYGFDVTCAGSVPQAITAFLESEGYEDAIRKAISIGGDSDTIACIAGAIAEAFYRGVPQNIADFALSKLDDTLRNVIAAFRQTYRGVVSWI